jgi:hypothetical protein
LSLSPGESALLQVVSRLKLKVRAPPNAFFAKVLPQVLKEDEGLRKKVLAALELKKVCAAHALEHYGQQLRRGDLSPSARAWCEYKVEAARAELRAIDEALKLIS